MRNLSLQIGTRTFNAHCADTDLKDERFRQHPEVMTGHQAGEV